MLTLLVGLLDKKKHEIVLKKEFQIKQVCCLAMKCQYATLT